MNRSEHIPSRIRRGESAVPSLFMALLFLAGCVGLGALWGLSETRPDTVFSQFQAAFGPSFPYLAALGLAGLIGLVLTIMIIWTISDTMERSSIRIARMDAQHVRLTTSPAQQGLRGRRDAAEYIQWPVFARLLRHQRHVSEVHKRPFVLVHLSLRPIKSSHGGFSKEQVSDSMQQLLKSHLRNSDLVSQTSSSNWFVLMPETNPSVAEVTTQTIVDMFRTKFLDAWRLDTKQHTYVGGRRRGTPHGGGRAVA